MANFLKYLKSSLDFKRTKKIIKSRAFLGSFLFAIAIWIYSSLNDVYTPVVKTPLQVKLPPSKAVENTLPENISVKVKGGGWQLFYLIFFNASDRCLIDLSDKDLPPKEYTVTRTDILKGLQNIVNVEPIDVYPENLKLKLGEVKSRKIAVNPIITVTPKEGFVAMSDIVVEPDSVIITGNEKVVKDINSWNTEPIRAENLYQSTVIKAPLSDTLETIVKLDAKEVDLKIEIQQKVELEIEHVPIRIKGGGLPNNHELQPAFISVFVSGGIKQITELTKDDIDSYIEYSEIVNDTTGILIPKANSNIDLSRIVASPSYIYHYRITKKFD